jgi:diguanylate cyclase (GGDEF)-like protein/PAS domain S-box-containing protein
VSSRVIIACYAAWMTVLSAAFYAFPAWHLVTWAMLGASSAVAVFVGTVWHRPRRRLPWWLLGVALLTFTAGDTTYTVLNEVLGADPFPSAADACYLATFVLIAAGMYRMARSGVTGRDRGSLLDALTLTFGLGLLSWIFLIDPHVRNPDLTFLERTISVAYPLGDVLILATLLRLVAAARRTAATILLTLGTLGLLVADVVYGLGQLNGSWQIGGPIDLGWVLLYGAWGAAALQPSMVELTEPRVIRHSEISVRRLALLALSSLIAPAVLLVEAAHRDVRDAQVIAVLSAVLFLLVLARLAGVVNIHRQGLSRERGLRQAGAALVSATDVVEVMAAVRATIARLLQHGVPHRVKLLISDPDSAAAGGVAVTERASELVYTASLDPALASELAEFDLTLRCPLVLDDRPAGDPLVGVLLVSADEATLVGLEGALEVLASQAALALERIALTNEINRRNSEEYFRTLAHNTSDIILIVNEDDRIRYASPSAATILGLDALGLPVSDVVHPDDRQRVARTLEAVRASEVALDVAVDRAWTVLRGDSSLLEVEASCRDLRDNRAVRGLVITLRDVTERRRLESELSHRALHDALTGMANRTLFQERVQRAISESHGVVGVLFIDLDDFKIVNDTMGHDAGDELLVAVGHRLAGAIGPKDLVARLGGDEFAALIEEATHPFEVEQVAERVVAALAQPFLVGKESVSGVASVGVATTADASDAQDLLRQADLALYLAKGAGKGQWRRYQATLHTAILERLELRGELDQAVADGAFLLHYQPIVDLNTGLAIGLEALVRWEHPTRGMISPAQFIEIAEESGLIVPIGGWVLEHAIEAMAGWQSMIPSAARRYISVNVSVRQVRAPGFVEEIRRRLIAAGLPPEYLVLEITESLLLRDDEEVWADLAALRELGVRVAIDDFGTGYSSLSYLRKIPADILKIDKSFIDGLGGSAQQSALVEGIVRLAHTLGLETIAEGIEGLVDRHLLADMGCPFGQGYLFSRPLEASEAVQWLLTEQVAV